MIRETKRRSYHFAKHVTPEHKPAVRDSPLKLVIVRVNVVRPICQLVFGKNHAAVQRILAGVLVMGIGVIVAKSVGHSSNALIAHIGDGIGYGLHGMGLIPIIEWITEKISE